MLSLVCVHWTFGKQVCMVHIVRYWGRANKTAFQCVRCRYKCPCYSWPEDRCWQRLWLCHFCGNV